MNSMGHVKRKMSSMYKKQLIGNQLVIVIVARFEYFVTGTERIKFSEQKSSLEHCSYPHILEIKSVIS